MFHSVNYRDPPGIKRLKRLPNYHDKKQRSVSAPLPISLLPYSFISSLHPEAPTPDPRQQASNVTLSPLQKEELASTRRKQMANAVQYIWETGEDKYMLRYFHTGFWLSCEKHNEGVCVCVCGAHSSLHTWVCTLRFNLKDP